MLPNSFSEKSYQYKLIERKGLHAIYHVTKDDYKCNSYEVIRIRENPAYEIGGKIVEAKEIFPSNEMWGIYGFTCLNLNEAKKRLKKMTAESPKSP